MEDFWIRLDRLLKDQKLTQIKLAELADISLNTIKKWKVKKVYPSTESIKKIAEILNVSIDNLITGEDIFDPAIGYIRKYLDIKTIVIKLGLNPELIPAVQGYLEGRLDSSKINRH